jgi:hypothetical protein
VAFKIAERKENGLLSFQADRVQGSDSAGISRASLPLDRELACAFGCQ